MEKDQIIILENRGLVSVTGDDAKGISAKFNYERYK